MKKLIGKVQHAVKYSNFSNYFKKVGEFINMGSRPSNNKIKVKISSVVPLAHIALLLMSFIYAANYSIAKIPFRSPQITSTLIVFLRVVISGLLYWSISLVSERKSIAKFFRKRNTRRMHIENFQNNFWTFFWCGLFLVPLSQILFFEGLKWTNPVNASLMRLGTPFMALLFGILANQEKFTHTKINGLIIAGIGATLVIISGNPSTLEISWKGDLMILVSAGAFAGYTIQAKKLMNNGYTAISVLKWSFLIGGSLFLALDFLRSFDPYYENSIIEQLLKLNWASLDNEIRWSLFYIFFFATAVSYLLNISALDKVPPSIAGAYNYIQPFFAALFACFLFGFKFPSYSILLYIIASLLIFMGIYWLNKNEYKILYISIKSYLKNQNPKSRKLLGKLLLVKQFLIPESVKESKKHLEKNKEIKVYTGTNRDLLLKKRKIEKNALNNNNKVPIKVTYKVEVVQQDDHY